MLSTITQVAALAWWSLVGYAGVPEACPVEYPIVVDDDFEDGSITDGVPYPYYRQPREGVIECVGGDLQIRGRSPGMSAGPLVVLPGVDTVRTQVRMSSSGGVCYAWVMARVTTST